MNKYEVFVDMDGVLANFHQAMEDHKLTNLSDMELWTTIERDHPEWFLNLKPMTGYKDLWNVAADMDKHEDPVVLTAISTKQIYRCVWQKQYWIAKYLSSQPPVITCLRSHKADYAGPNRILIDDSEDNVQGWIKNGGIGVHYKNHKQAIEELLFIREFIREIES